MVCQLVIIVYVQSYFIEKTNAMKLKKVIFIEKHSVATLSYDQRCDYLVACLNPYFVNLKLFNFCYCFMVGIKLKLTPRQKLTFF